MTKIFSAFSYNAIPTDVRKYLTNLVTKKMKKRHTEGVSFAVGIDWFLIC